MTMGGRCQSSKNRGGRGRGNKDQKSKGAEGKGKGQASVKATDLEFRIGDATQASDLHKLQEATQNKVRLTHSQPTDMSHVTANVEEFDMESKKPTLQMSTIDAAEAAADPAKKALTNWNFLHLSCCSL